MLRITVMGADELTVTLEGRLSGPWVDELDRCWSSLTATGDAGSIRVDLDGVTFVDAAGRALLRAMCAQGTSLLGSGCMTRATIEEIEREARERGAADDGDD